MLARLKGWARVIRRDVLAVWLAARDPRTPWYARALALVVAAYALSPIDLIPDVIPVLGYLDDVILVPLGILAVVALVPKAVMAECRARAEAAAGRPISRAGAAFVVAVWVLLGLAAGWAAWRHLAG
jgi:uncharacterized membrane protein YkvA (DUF1232 family)